MQAREYSVSELCKLVSAKTDSSPSLVVDAAIADARINLDEKEMMIWELLETLYLDKGWRLEERGDKELVLKAKK